MSWLCEEPAGSRPNAVCLLLLLLLLLVALLQVRCLLLVELHCNLEFFTLASSLRYHASHVRRAATANSCA